MPKTQQDAGPVYEYTRPVVKRVGREEGALKQCWGCQAVHRTLLPNTGYTTFVYFSQLSAHKKGLGTRWLLGHLLEALNPLKQLDKMRPPPPTHIRLVKKGSGGLPLPSCPTPSPLLQE